MADHDALPERVWELLEAGLYAIAASRVDGSSVALGIGMHEWRERVLRDVNEGLGGECADRLRLAFDTRDRRQAQEDRLELRDRQRTWDERRRWRDD